MTTATWQVLSRTDNRCGSLIPAGTVEAKSGQTIRVPEPGAGEVVFVRIHGLENGGFERLRSFLYKPGLRTATISDGDTYRLVRATASDGLLLRSKGVAGQDHGHFSQIPQTRTLRVDGGDGQLEYEFFRMRVRPGIAAVNPRL